MVEPIYCLKPAWCGRHLAGLRPETGLTVRYGATAFKAVGFTGVPETDLAFFSEGKLINDTIFKRPRDDNDPPVYGLRDERYVLMEGLRIDGPHVRDAVRREIVLGTPEKSYRLNDEIATLLVRPRGWHLREKHVLVDGEPISASLFDFGLYMFHCAQRLLDAGSGPYFYLPKLESHLEARLWNDVFAYSEDALGLERGARSTRSRTRSGRWPRPSASGSRGPGQ